MFSSLSNEAHLSGGQRSSSPTGHGVMSPVLHSQESPWISLLSVVYRPALSFLQKYLPGRPRTAALCDDLKNSFVDEESEFLRQLDDMMPLPHHAAPHLTYLRCERDGAAGLLQPTGGNTLPWLTADSLREIGIQSTEEMDLNLCQQTQISHLSSARTFLSHVRLSSSQEIKPTAAKDWVAEAASSSVQRGKSRTWWGSFWGGEESSQKRLLSDLSWAEDATLTGQLCPQQLFAEIKAPAAETADVFVQGGSRGWMLGENTRPTDHKEEQADNGGLQTVQNREGSTPDQRLSISNHLSSSGVAAACSEVALLTPDQDNGYSSLEEEHFQMCHLCRVKAPSEEQPQTGSTETCAAATAAKTEMDEETAEESTSGKADEEEGRQEDEAEQEAAAQESQCVEATVLTTPQCQNKAIAFIMGCPCSDDSSQSDGESSDDDDGFDSEGSSDLSDSTDEDEDDDDEDSDGEADSETARLWSSLCQSVDPYNPRNFTARLHTSSTPPRTIPASTPPSSTQSSPASSPDLTPLPLSAPPLSSSPPSGHDVWDDSTSASEVDEAESLRLWASFSCSSDPYSPFNFQAPLRTRAPVEAGPRTRVRAKRASQIPPRHPRHSPTSPPEYRKEEAEERLDSGFSEPSTSSITPSCSTTKKVRFCDDVEEFFASCGEEEEDRRGPWEELARDRCRFLRRCQEVEQSIAYCLQPQHRSLVYHRLTVLCEQDA